MCELFGVTSERKVCVNDYLKIFFSHSIEHHNGWGLALLDNMGVAIEKEPARAVDSLYLKNRLTGKVETSVCMAHIRKATIGDVSFNNTHPFARCDKGGRRWVFVHNGTIFESASLVRYLYHQEGTTDSERILLYIVDRVDKEIERKCDGDSKCRLIDDIVHELTPGNKVNFLLYDGTYMYVHKNEPGTLYRNEEDGTVFFSTHPLDDTSWEEVEQNTLLVYRSGKLIYKGRQHDNTYHHDEAKMKLIYLDHAML